MPEALERAILMAQGGEFAFVLFTTAAASGLITADQQDLFTATVIISMVLTPLTSTPSSNPLISLRMIDVISSDRIAIEFLPT